MKLIKVKIKERPLRDYFGYAYTDKNLIELRKGMKDRTYLGTLIHELLHICLPNECETVIDRYASTITHYVWKKGYRRNANKKRNSGKNL